MCAHTCVSVGRQCGWMGGCQCGWVSLSIGSQYTACIAASFFFLSPPPARQDANRKPQTTNRKALTGLEELEALGERVRGPRRGHHRPVLRFVDWIGGWVWWVSVTGLGIRYQELESNLVADRVAGESGEKTHTGGMAWYGMAWHGMGIIHEHAS